jgi:hypothetical protein
LTHNWKKESAMSQEHSVVGIYTHIDQAEDALRTLGQAGFPIQHVSIIA